MEIKDTMVEDAGPYTCIAKNTAGEATAQIPLKVNGEGELWNLNFNHSERLQKYGCQSSFDGQCQKYIICVKIKSSKHITITVCWRENIYSIHIVSFFNNHFRAMLRPYKGTIIMLINSNCSSFICFYNLLFSKGHISIIIWHLNVDMRILFQKLNVTNGYQSRPLCSDTKRKHSRLSSWRSSRTL